MPVPLPPGIDERYMSDRDINILVEKILDLTEYINNIISLNRQIDPNRETQNYLIYATRMLVNRIYNFADAHGFMLAEEYVAPLWDNPV